MSPVKLYLMGILIHMLPETKFFSLKNRLYRICGSKIGKNVRICSSARIIGSGILSIGDNTWIGPDCLISVSSKIEIGTNCDIAPRVYIGNGTHKITPDRSRIADIEISKDIKIGDGCWICVNSTILPGVEIGEKCVVAAGAVVTKSVESYSMFGGVPAKVIKKLR